MQHTAVTTQCLRTDHGFTHTRGSEATRAGVARCRQRCGGLGRFLIDGQAYRDYGQMAAGALLVAALAVLVDLDACDWQETDLYALALQASERFQRDEQTLSLFTYDLREYKQVPDWLNAKFWANPELFGRYWW